MFDSVERLRSLEIKREKQIQKIRSIESYIRELLDKEQTLRSQGFEERLNEVENQEEVLLNKVVVELAALDQIDLQLEAFYVDL